MKDEIIQYLYDSGFVANYVKKLMYSDDIDDLYQDYVQEVWLQILLVKEERWNELYNPNKKDRFYEVRNWVSVLIRNTVSSSTSTAYRRLKKQSTITKKLDTEEWHYLENIIPETRTMSQTILSL